MNGVEVYVQLGGDSFTLHRSEFYGGNEVFDFRGKRKDSVIDTGPRSIGFTASNMSGTGGYHWVYIPHRVLDGFDTFAGGSTKEIAFKDVKIGPEYLDRVGRWWEK